MLDGGASFVLVEVSVEEYLVGGPDCEAEESEGELDEADGPVDESSHLPPRMMLVLHAGDRSGHGRQFRAGQRLALGAAGVTFVSLGLGGPEGVRVGAAASCPGRVVAGRLVGTQFPPSWMSTSGSYQPAEPSPFVTEQVKVLRSMAPKLFCESTDPVNVYSVPWMPPESGP